MKPQYKYNLDDYIDALNTEPAELKKRELETQEAILSVFMPAEPKDFFDKVGAMRRAGVEGGDHDSLRDLQLDAASYSKLTTLLHKRTYGEYKDDLDGFT